MKFLVPKMITDPKDIDLNKLAHNILLIRYKNKPTPMLSKQILKYCPEEKWRISILEIDENFCNKGNECKKITQKNFTCECEKRSFSNVGRVIGKGGKNLKEIENQTNTNIFFDKTKKCFILRKKFIARDRNTSRNITGNLFQAVDLILNGLKNEHQEFTDWEKYYFWWYHFNKS